MATGTIPPRCRARRTMERRNLVGLATAAILFAACDAASTRPSGAGGEGGDEPGGSGGTSTGGTTGTGGKGNTGTGGATATGGTTGTGGSTGGSGGMGTG